jgi:hypothetical protein
MSEEGSTKTGRREGKGCRHGPHVCNGAPGVETIRHSSKLVEAAGACETAWLRAPVRWPRCLIAPFTLPVRRQGPRVCFSRATVEPCPPCYEARCGCGRRSQQPEAGILARPLGSGHIWGDCERPSARLAAVLARCLRCSTRVQRAGGVGEGEGERGAVWSNTTYSRYIHSRYAFAPAHSQSRFTTCRRQKKEPPARSAA